MKYSVAYAWNQDNTVSQRTETDYTPSTTQTHVTSFSYDHRKRLIAESRVMNTSTTVYDLEYEYDQLGNRTQKTDNIGGVVTDYVYDTTSNEPGFETQNNRLRYYTETVGSTVRRKVSYLYYKTGHVANITVKDNWYTGAPGSAGDYDWYYDIAFYYAADGKLWRTLKDKWTIDAKTGDPENYEKLSALEFYCDSGRQRWLVREVDADSGEATTSWQFTDYSGEQPYLDYEVEFDFGADPPTADAYDTMRYLPGQSPDREGGVVHAQQAASNGAARYYHADLTGSTNALTDTSGAMLTGGTTTNGGPFYYTSFGERVYYDSGSSSWKLGGEFPIGSPRYLYDGGHGYETGHLALSGANSTLAPITFQHVGQRWYQPEIGRFVQRDTIGLAGGINVYQYVGACAVSLFDPDGQCLLDRTWAEWFLDNTGGRRYVPVCDPGPEQDIVLTVTCSP